MSDIDVIKQANAIKRAQKIARKAALEQRRQYVPKDLPLMNERYTLICSDIRDAVIESESIDCIITDPPYPALYIDSFKYLAEAAMKWLKPGGSLLTMSGQSYLPGVLQRLTSVNGLNYHWTLAYLTPGGQAVQVFPRKVNTFWKPVFWFVKGEYKEHWIGDVTKSAVNDNDKRFHGWGQSESGMFDIINRVTFPGQRILDPFVGGGTTGVVAVATNRLFTGIDISQDAIITTASRLKELVIKCSGTHAGPRCADPECWNQ